MNKILLMTIMLASFQAFGGTCTSDSYTAASANSILTSTKYNSDNSTLYTRLAGNFDGGCVADGTIEDGGLNTTDFVNILNYYKDGCLVTLSDTNTLSVNKCAMAVNGAFVRTTVANTATWGCTGCEAEATSTIYYLYAKTGSSGTTLNLDIDTEAPNADGYNTDNDKVLAKFYNNSADDIVDRIANWNGHEFIDISTFGVRIANAGTPAITSQTGSPVASLTDDGVGATTLTFTVDYFLVTPAVVAISAGGNRSQCIVDSESTAATKIICEDSNTGNDGDNDFNVTLTRQGADVW